MRCIHTVHLQRCVHADVDASRPWDSPSFEKNFPSLILVNVILGSCGTRTGECSATAICGPHTNLRMSPIPVVDATLWLHSGIILLASSVHFGFRRVTAAFTLPRSCSVITAGSVQVGDENKTHPFVDLLSLPLRNPSRCDSIKFLNSSVLAKRAYWCHFSDMPLAWLASILPALLPFRPPGELVPAKPAESVGFGSMSSDGRGKSPLVVPSKTAQHHK